MIYDVAIASAASNGPNISAALLAGQSGDVVRLSAGVYDLVIQVSGECVLASGKSNITLRGAGTTLRLVANNSEVDWPSIVNFLNCAGCLFEGITVDGQHGIIPFAATTPERKAFNGLQAKGCTDFSARNFTVVNSDAHQVEIQDCVGVLLEDFETANLAGALPSVATHGIDIDIAGLSVVPTADVMLRRGVMYNPHGDASKTEHADGVTYEDCIFNSPAVVTNDSAADPVALQNITFTRPIFNSLVKIGFRDSAITITSPTFGESGQLRVVEQLAGHAVNVSDPEWAGISNGVVSAIAGVYSADVPACVSITGTVIGLYSGALRAWCVNNNPYPESPFLTPATAIDTITALTAAAVDGQELIVRDDVYTGAANKGIRLWGKDIVLRAEVVEVVIDLENATSGAALSPTDGEPSTAKIQGFLVKNGSAEATIGDTYQGLGCLYGNSSVRLKNVTFQDCFAQNGGGMRINSVAAAPVLEDVSFLDCGAQKGGGLDISNAASVTLWRTQFRRCTATAEGAAVKCGGPLHGITTLISECTSAANTAPVLFTGTDEHRLDHLTSSLNACAGAQSVYCYNSAAILRNAICYNDGAPEFFEGGASTVTATDCCVKGGWSGSGNIPTDPLLLPEGLRQQASPCVDAGAVIVGVNDGGQEDLNGFTVEGAPNIGMDQSTGYLSPQGSALITWTPAYAVADLPVDVLLNILSFNGVAQDFLYARVTALGEAQICSKSGGVEIFRAFPWVRDAAYHLQLHWGELEPQAQPGVQLFRLGMAAAGEVAIWSDAAAFAGWGDVEGTLVAAWENEEFQCFKLEMRDVPGAWDTDGVWKSLEDREMVGGQLQDSESRLLSDSEDQPLYSDWE